jgi:GWxTD domain-containing protein
VSKKLTFFLCLLVISGLSYAQPVIPKLLYSDFIRLDSDSLSGVYYLYKVPLNHLVFEKEADLFLAQYRMSVEVFDADNQRFITRAMKEKNIQVPDYEQTVSPLIFSEGILKLNVGAGIYTVTEIFYDYKSGREVKSPAHQIKIDSSGKMITPLITVDQTVECNDKMSPVLANYGGSLPFDEKKYSFNIPVENLQPDSLFVNVIQYKDTLYNGVLSNPLHKNISLSECGGKILLDEEPGGPGNKIFRLDGISQSIAEGGFEINISEKNNFIDQKKFMFSCRWVDKPFSLRDPETAIKALKFIAADSVISSLLSGDEEDYARNLAEYWKKIDPTPGTEFNPLMKEYYKRIDYAAKNFNTIGGSNGANTDRGKVYIRFGKPFEVDRTSDNYGNIIETWTYNNPQRKFVFVDKKGTGDFSLISG